MNVRRARGAWIAWLCIGLGAALVLYGAVRFARGTGGILALVAGAPVLGYGVLMRRALRRP